MSVKPKGFTLIELAVAMAVSGLCIVLALGAWVRFRAITLQREQHYLHRMDCELRLNAQRKTRQVADSLIGDKGWVRLYAGDSCPADIWVDIRP